MHHAPCTSCKRQKRSLKMHFLPAHTPTLHLHGVGWVSAVVEQSLCRLPWRSDVLAASLRNYSRHSFTPQQKNHTSITIGIRLVGTVHSYAYVVGLLLGHAGDDAAKALDHFQRHFFIDRKSVV